MTISLKIPVELTNEKSDSINYSYLKNKTIVGFIGYSRSGKDTLGKVLVNNLGFTRVSFGDMLKIDLDAYMKESVLEDLKNKGTILDISDIEFLNPKNTETKEILRPYMIWFAEELKRINGLHYWTNRAFSLIKENQKKLVFTDIRRVNELDIFELSENILRLKDYEIMLIHNYGYKSLLLHVNQLNLDDSDDLTKLAILEAQRRWLISKTIFIDSKVKVEMREEYINEKVRNITIEYPKYLI